MAWLSSSLRRLGAALSGTPPTPSGDSTPAPAPGTGALGTDAGMFALWDREAFPGVVDYDTWEAELLENEDMRRHIRAGHLVPVGTRSDGAFGFAVRVGSADAPAALGDRERRYLAVSSEPYRVRSPGRLYLSGIEYIHAEPEAASVMAVDVPPGPCAVTVHLLDWDEEPGMTDEAGRPTPDALPDFLVLVNPTAAMEGFRQSVDTFDEPDDEA
jgi:hypothetical protein